MTSDHQKNLVSKLPKEIHRPKDQPSRTSAPRTPKRIEHAALSNSKARTTSPKDGKPTTHQILSNATNKNSHWYNRWLFNPKPLNQDIETARQAIRDERRLLDRMDAEVYATSSSIKNTTR